uniref:Uncharacterized protein n=1 Tax=Salix viminalis TaxID=40686 RepID=A0A6N2NI15_SALVM
MENAVKICREKNCPLLTQGLNASDLLGAVSRAIHLPTFLVSDIHFAKQTILQNQANMVRTSPAFKPPLV